MTHTIEDIKRLVPEAIQEKNAFTSAIWSIGGRSIMEWDPTFQALLFTRAQLEVAVECLNGYANETVVPFRAREALANIGEIK